jgi:MFS superfamily sulfate permease-like transporter
VFAALRLIDYAELRRITRLRRSELFLALATTAAVLIFDVPYGIAVAVSLSILDLLRRIARPHDGIPGFVPELAGMHDIDHYATGARFRACWSIARQQGGDEKTGGGLSAPYPPIPAPTERPRTARVSVWVPTASAR